MKYPFLFLFVSVVLSTVVFVLVGAAAFVEVKDLIGSKASTGDFPAD
jgi:hypothetical protein